MTRLIAELTTEDVAAHQAAGRTTVVMALGATEQHGPHMPMATDTLLGDELARRVAADLDALIAPTLTLGCSEHHTAFAGTLSISWETFAAIIADVVASFARGGFQRAVLLPSHGGNFAPLAAAVEQLRAPAGLRVSALTDIRILAGLPYWAVEHEQVPLAEGGMHAGEWETSLLLATDPRLVLMDRRAPGFLGSPEEALGAVFADGVRSISPNGVLGDPARANPERGRRYWTRVQQVVMDALEPEPGATHRP